MDRTGPAGENFPLARPFLGWRFRLSSERVAIEGSHSSAVTPAASDLAQLLQRADGTDPAAAERLFVLLYDELHRLAERHLRGGNSGLTLGTTTLVHEVYLSMAGRSEMAFPDRERFFAYASRAMRGLVVDYTRRRCARKRGRQFEITLTADDGRMAVPVEEVTDLTALNEALTQLAVLDPRLAELVDLHFFGGFSLVEIATFRGVAERTVQRDWRKARMLLHRALQEAGGAADA